MIDYLIVGLGLAGISFCEQLEKYGKTYKVVSDASQTSSVVAGGLYNPVILKRLTMAWNAKEQLDLASPFYRSLEDKLNVKLDYKVPVLRRFASVEEQNMWFEASDKRGLKDFLSPEIQRNNNPNINAPLGFGEVLHTGRIDTELLISAYTKYLFSKESFLREAFDHKALQVALNSISYKSIQAKRIVFAEGFGLMKNPFFNYLPLTGIKGEYIIIKAPELNEPHVIKSSIFIIPKEKDIYRVGATYQRDDYSNLSTKKARQELVKKLDALIDCEYQLVDQMAGIRPVVVDRRPLIGQHPKYENLYVINGFGSRGVIIAPYASKQLYEFIEIKNEISTEMDINRFAKRISKKNQ